MNKKIPIIMIFLLILHIIMLLIFRYIEFNKYDKLKLNGIDNLMIVAHPDDESLWGGVHLAEADYLVVCVTCGSDEQRQKEFEKVIKEFGNKGISLGFPDIENNVISDWSKVYYKIEKELRKIINYKDWDMIVTHNPDGEYGHMHHIMVSTMVTKNADKNKLYYFNKYYTKEEIENINYCMKEINDRELHAKMILLNNYSSQSGVVDNHSQNIKYEKLILYKYWN